MRATSPRVYAFTAAKLTTGAAHHKGYGAKYARDSCAQMKMRATPALRQDARSKRTRQSRAGVRLDALGEHRSARDLRISVAEYDGARSFRLQRRLRMTRWVGPTRITPERRGKTRDNPRSRSAYTAVARTDTPCVAKSEKPVDSPPGSVPRAGAGLGLQIRWESRRRDSGGFDSRPLPPTLAARGAPARGVTPSQGPKWLLGYRAEPVEIGSCAQRSGRVSASPPRERIDAVDSLRGVSGTRYSKAPRHPMDLSAFSRRIPCDRSSVSPGL